MLTQSFTNHSTNLLEESKQSGKRSHQHRDADGSSTRAPLIVEVGRLQGARVRAKSIGRAPRLTHAVLVEIVRGGDGVHAVERGRAVVHTGAVRRAEVATTLSESQGRAGDRIVSIHIALGALIAESEVAAEHGELEAERIHTSPPVCEHVYGPSM